MPTTMALKVAQRFRFNPEAFQGVLVKEKDLEKHHLPVHIGRWLKS